MTSPPTIETDRLILRPLGLQDFEPLADFYESDRSKFVGGPETREWSWRTLALEIGHWTLRGYGRFGVDEKASGALAGLVGPWNPLGWPEPEIGWDLMNGFEGKGYATEAGAAALVYAYRNLGWTTAISLVAIGNDGSAAVARRLGATHERNFSHERFGEMQVWRHRASGAS
ncbi:MAG: GNAT family N-acetyltransferase [Pseudomonadota bacterium]